ncbi:MAG: tail fiber domain-containing protein [Woeseiaceae bacterium]
MKYLSVLLTVLLPLAGHADQVVPADKVEDSVNIRLNADATSDVVGKLRQGESLTLINSIDGWHEVRLEGGTSGFISSDWSRVVADSAAAPAEEAVADEAVEALVEETLEVLPEETAAEVAEEVAAEIVDVVVVEVGADAAEEVADAVDEVVLEERAAEPGAVVEPEPVTEAPAVVATQPSPEVVPAREVSANRDFLVKVRRPGELVDSQIFDDGNRVGIGSTEPQQRLEVNGSIQIHDQNSSVAGLMITQSSGDTGYIMHNRASTLTIGAGSIDRITIDRDGHVGFGASRPDHPLEMASGAHVTAGGVWTNRSSRDSKENIAVLSSGDAVAAVMALQPVSFNYRAEEDEDYVGFIAEDVPGLLASSDGKSLSTMDIVAALTKVVQEQQRRIDELEARLERGQSHKP